jgi:hypothetical protein
MFSWFRRKKEEPLVFADAATAFAYACAELENRLLLDAVLPALVEARDRLSDEGEQYYRLRLACRHGGRPILACTLKEASGRPDIGDLVGFKVVRYDESLPGDMGLLGFIACRLEPVFIPGRGWRIAASFIPPNIKPVLRM